MRRLTKKLARAPGADRLPGLRSAKERARTPPIPYRSNTPGELVFRITPQDRRDYALLMLAACAPGTAIWLFGGLPVDLTLGMGMVFVVPITLWTLLDGRRGDSFGAELRGGLLSVWGRRGSLEVDFENIADVWRGRAALLLEMKDGTEEVIDGTLAGDKLTKLHAALREQLAARG